MCRSLSLGTQVAEILFRTINPKIVSAAQRDFGKEVQIADPAFEEVPNRGRIASIGVNKDQVYTAA